MKIREYMLRLFSMKYSTQFILFCMMISVMQQILVFASEGSHKSLLSVSSITRITEFLLDCFISVLSVRDCFVRVYCT